MLSRSVEEENGISVRLTTISFLSLNRGYSSMRASVCILFHPFSFLMAPRLSVLIKEDVSSVFNSGSFKMAYSILCSLHFPIVGVC